MNIIVCMKVVPKSEQVRLDPETRMLDRSGAENEINEPDKNALEMALQLRETYGGKVTVLSMGPPQFEPYMRLAVAMGVDDAILLSDRALAGADTLATSYALAQAIGKIDGVDLVLAGEESSDGSTAQVPPGIAEWLGWSQITYAAELELLPEGRLKGKRTVHGGHEILSVPLPAVVSVELGVNSPRFPDFRRKRWADREFELTVWNAADVDADPARIGFEGSRSWVSDLIAKEQPERRREIITGALDEKLDRLIGIVVEHLEAGT